MFGEPIRDAVGILGDRLRFLRWQRQLRIADEVNKLLSERGVTKTRAVPPKLALPILENASLEEDNTLQDLWIRLLTNAMDPTSSVDVRYALLDILKSLTPLDVRILAFFYEALKQNPKVELDQITEYSLTRQQICQALNIDDRAYGRSVYNLFRVQCIAPAILKGGIRISGEPITVFKGADAVTMTPLGRDLVEACIAT